MGEQLREEHHPLVRTSRIFQSDFVDRYSNYTGVGISMSSEEKKGIHGKLVEENKHLN